MNTWCLVSYRAHHMPGIGPYVTEKRKTERFRHLHIHIHAEGPIILVYRLVWYQYEPTITAK